MRLRLFTSLLLGCALPVAAVASQDMELTGLADGPIRVALVKLQPGDQHLMLYLGKTTAGITLKDLDVKGGWALLEQGTNQIRLRLAHYLTLENNHVAPGNASAAAQFRLRQIQAVTAAKRIDWSLATSAVVGQVPGVNGGNSPGYPSQETAGAYSVVHPDQTARLEPSPSTPGWVTGNQSGNSSPSGLPANQPGDRFGQVSLINDPEGDRIRGLFGTQAFLAWDLAHADRWKQGAAQ